MLCAGIILKLCLSFTPFLVLIDCYDSSVHMVREWLEGWKITLETNFFPFDFFMCMCIHETPEANSFFQGKFSLNTNNPTPHRCEAAHFTHSNDNFMESHFQLSSS